MYIKPYIDRIKAQCPIFTKVDFPISVSTIKGLSDTPSVFCFWTQKPASTLDKSVTTQRCVEDFQVMVVAQALTIDNTAEPLADALQQLDDALIGWVPFAGRAPVTRTHAALEDIDGDLFWVKVFYQTHYYHRSLN